MKNRRIKTDIEEKMCKKCKNEYTEKENFNWSCRTHQSAYGESMWWCCGKERKEAAGCIFGKHQSKDDEEEQEEDGESDEKKNTICFSCKEKGHKMEECPFDPNYKTNVFIRKPDSIQGDNKDLIDQEHNRIIRMKLSPVVQSTSIIHLTEIMEDCIQQREFPEHPFGLGIMKFDDFNYTCHNSQILRSADQLKEIVRQDSEENQLQFVITQEKMTQFGRIAQDFKHNETQDQALDSEKKEDGEKKESLKSESSQDESEGEGEEDWPDYIQKRAFNKEEKFKIIEEQDHDTFNDILIEEKEFNEFGCNLYSLTKDEEDSSPNKTMKKKTMRSMANGKSMKRGNFKVNPIRTLDPRGLSPEKRFGDLGGPESEKTDREVDLDETSKQLVPPEDYLNDSTINSNIIKPQVVSGKNTMQLSS